MKNFSRYGISIPQILLPENIDTATWSVVACDQYTQDRDYWKKVEQTVSGKNSTLNIILPEVYLNDDDKPQRIAGGIDALPEAVRCKQDAVGILLELLQ